MFIQYERLTQFMKDSLGNALSMQMINHSGQDNREFVPSKTCNRIRLTNTSADAFGSLDQ